MPDATKYTSKLQNKRILVTGGSSGIGYAVAEAALEHGAIVTIASSSAAKLAAAKATLLASTPSAGTRLSTYAIDLSSAATLEQNVLGLLAFCTSEGKLDHIVHSAGDALPIAPLSSLTVGLLQSLPMVRFFAAFIIAKHASTHMNSGPDSSLTITTGSVGEKPIPGWAAGGFFASGVHGMVRGLALDLRPLRVNGVSPGAVETPLWDGVAEDMRKTLMEGVVAKSATGRIGRPEDVAEAYLYLMRDGNVTASMVSSNGGGLIM